MPVSFTKTLFLMKREVCEVNDDENLTMLGSKVATVALRDAVVKAYIAYVLDVPTEKLDEVLAYLERQGDE